MKLPSLLIVDDAAENLQILSELLRDFYKIKVAKSGEKALEILEGADLPDLILLDIQMPELNGYEVLKQLRQDPIIEDVPVLALTANAMSGDKRLCMEAGFDDYLTKPIFREELFRKVTQHLKQATTT